MMRFWDASALIPLCVDQPASPAVRALLREDAGMVVWWGSVVECWSALARLRREGLLSVEEEDRARGVLALLQEAWVEIQPQEAVRALAGRLLRVHPLRAADALQLAAALVWAGSPAVGEMVVLDRRLREAARLEGLRPLPDDDR
jgi:predicted nucleic acid-binding protein